MSFHRACRVTALSVVVSVGSMSPGVMAQRPTSAASAPTRLTALDHIQIQQLVRRYAWALDSGDNYGYAYADLFTPDGVFVGTNQGPTGRSYQGRDELAALARGGTRGANYQSHFLMNHVITPEGSGATGQAYVAMLDIGIAGKPNAVNHGGFYEDVYEKTPVGWRFKRRSYYESKVSVWPESVTRPAH